MDIIEDFEKSFFEIKTITDSISSKLDSEIDVLLDMKTMEKQAQDFLEKEWQDNTEKVIEKESPIETTSEVADKYNLDPKCVERISELTERLDIILDGIEPEPIILDYLENPVEPRLTKRNKKRAVL